MNKEDLYSLLKTEQTPLYVYDTDILADRIRLIREAFGGRIRLCYAMKTNPMLTGLMAQSADHFEVCSPGEFAICERLGIAPEKIVYSGVYKDPVSTRHAFEVLAGSGVMTIESLTQLALLDEISRGKGRTADVMIRIACGSQFGIDTETAMDLLENRSRYPYLNPVGFQMYSGTQKRKMKFIETELERLDAVITEAQRYGFETQAAEYGPGLPVNHFSDDSFDETEMLHSLAAMLDTMAFQGPVTIEMGRFIASYCGYYAVTVRDVKVNDGRGYLITDGGNHQLKYYGQSFGMKKPAFDHLRKNENAGEEKKWDICGALCTVNDVLVRDVLLKSPSVGDVFVFQNCGDYSATEGSALFLSRDIPAAYSFGTATGMRLLRKRCSTAEFNCPETDGSSGHKKVLDPEV